LWNIRIMDEAQAPRQRGAGDPLASEDPAVLRIGCPPKLPIQRLLALLGALGMRAPHVEARVLHDTPAAEQLRRLAGGGLDVAMLYGADRQLEVDIEPVFPGEQLVAFLPPGHPLTANDVLGPTDLLDVDLVIFPRADDPALFEHLLAELDRGGYRFRQVVEASGGHVRDVLLAVSGGRGIAIDSSSLADLADAREMVVHRALDPPLRMPDIVLAWLPRHAHQLEHVLGLLRDVARDLRRAGRQRGEETG
jgi:DNA-binding transcriptional LysR family regulator